MVLAGFSLLVAGVESIATVAVATPQAVSGPVSHPDADHMGSTIRAHEPTLSPAQTEASPLLQAQVAGQPLGMDVSAYQGNVNWPATTAAGGKFVYVKASEATGYLNPYFAQQYNESAAAGLFRGAYHFALPDRSSGAIQANYFVDHGGSWSGDGTTLPPMLDIEYNPYGPTCYNLTPAQMSAWIADFSTTVHARTGRFPIIYTTQNWWDFCTGSNASFAGTNPLFLARYSTSPGLMPAGWSFQTIWQYSDSGPLPGDQDVFNGSLTQLQSFSAPPIAVYYGQLGGASSYLGAPVGDEYAVTGGSAQNYQYGMIYYSPATGAHAVHGAILSRYLALGGPAGLGFPTTDESPAANGGRYNNFEYGAITWSPTAGAHETHGAIRARWAALGYESGPLGFPTSDEYPVPGGTAQNYEHGTLTWNQATGQVTVVLQ